jgi:hypothetical protein
LPSLSLDLLAKDNASAAIKGMTGSILSANFAMAGLRQIANFAAQSIGNAVKSNTDFKKVTDDVTVNVNALSMTLGGMLVGALKSSLESLRGFTGEAQNIKNIGGAFAIIIQYGKRLITDVFDMLKVAMKPVVDAFKSFSKEGNASAGAMQALAVVMEVISSVLSLVGAYLGAVIKYFFSLVNVVIESTKTIGIFFEMLSGKKKWDDVKVQLGETGKAIGDMAKALVNGYKEIITSSISEAKTFQDRIKKTTEENTKILKEGGDKALADFEKNQGAIRNASEKGDKEDLAKKKEKQDQEKQGWMAFASGMIDLQKSMMATLSQINDQYFSDRLAAVSEWKESHLAEIDDWVSREEEKAGVKEESGSERLQREIRELQGNLTKKQTAEEKTATQTQIKEKQSELKRLQIKEEAEKKTDHFNKEAAKKELKIKKEQFEANKTLAIINIWLNAASSVMGWWAGFASMGIPGIVLAAVMTAATLVMAGVQTGIVASQTFHGKEGGLVNQGALTGDNTLLFANKGEALLKSDTYNNLERKINGSSSFGGGTFNIGTLILQGVNSPDELAYQLNEVARTEGAR